jgi:hypothetical protein
MTQAHFESQIVRLDSYSVHYFLFWGTKSLLVNTISYATCPLR